MHDSIESYVFSSIQYYKQAVGSLAYLKFGFSGFLRRPQNLKKSLSYFWKERCVLFAQQHTCQKVDEDFFFKCGQVVLYKL